jgi:hypothetical protein
MELVVVEGLRENIRLFTIGIANVSTVKKIFSETYIVDNIMFRKNEVPIPSSLSILRFFANTF